MNYPYLTTYPVVRSDINTSWGFRGPFHLEKVRWRQQEPVSPSAAEDLLHVCQSLWKLDSLTFHTFISNYLIASILSYLKCVTIFSFLCLQLCSILNQQFHNCLFSYICCCLECIFKLSSLCIYLCSILKQQFHNCLIASI